MRGFVHALIVAVPALVGGGSAVRAADTTCTSTLTGTIDGNVVVPDGASCTLSDATVAGNVHVLQNASLTVDATQQPTTIEGHVHADHCAFALLEGGVTVTGNVRIAQCAQQSGFVGPGIKIGGNFECTKNAGACEVDLGDVHGNLQIDGNSGASADISLVSVGGNLRCQGNTPMPTHAFGPDFVSGDLKGQCAASLGFAPPRTAPSCIASTLNVPNLTVASAIRLALQPTFPEVCLVTGAVATSGEGYGPGSAQFSVALPVHWNGRFMFFGCGGFCGTLSPTSGAVSISMVDGLEALTLGYATVTTDAGHEQDPSTPDLTWAVSETGVVNMPAIIDYQFRAVHQVTVATKQYVEAHYSQPIDHAYFDGCAVGGRQSLIEGERYPVDYDGLVAGDAAIYGLLSNFKEAKAFIPTLAYIPYSTLAQVDTAVKASCDALDGVTDGLIQNPALCSFVPSSLVRGGVLTASQAAALKSYITRGTDSSGAPLFPGMPISDLSTAGFEGGVEISTPAIDPTAAEPWGAKGLGPIAWEADVYIRTFVEQNQSFDVNNDWPETVSAAGNVIPDATLALLALVAQRTGGVRADDPFKLANFLKKGGKLILYHGGSDPLLSPFKSIWFYEELASLHGGYRNTQHSARLFIVPGMGHCGGGVAPNSFDTLQALDNWVTNGVAPEGIVATAPNGRTMPLCKFPEEASYSGSGDVNLAANWSCNPNDERMLQVGRDGVTAGADRATALEFLYEAIGLNGQ